mgnify:CR=1 FL=1
MRVRNNPCAQPNDCSPSLRTAESAVDRLHRRARGECDRRYRTRRIRSLWRDHRRQLASRLDHSCVLRTLFHPTACTCQAHLRPYASCHFLRLPPATCTSAHELNHSHSYALAFTEKHRGFAFVQFDDKGDAADAIDNMNGGELFGRVLRVNLAKPDAAMRGSHRPGASTAPLRTY